MAKGKEKSKPKKKTNLGGVMGGAIVRSVQEQKSMRGPRKLKKKK